MTSTFSRLDAVELHEGLRSEAEIALLDVREEGAFSAQHILTASNAPISRFERLSPALVPRHRTPIVLVDADESITAQAVRILNAHGYASVAVLKGGMSGWIDAGYRAVSGVHVPSKAFGEFVEVAYPTPHIEAADLKRCLDAGEDVAILDSRPFDEYNWISIPGAVDCPNGEIVLRARGTVPSPETLVVVTCGGRTRSIIGAQSLIDAGLPNRVVSLKNGTQGWHLSGLEVARGQTNVAPLPRNGTLQWAREAAARIERRFGVRVIDGEALARFEREKDERTLYRFDVRSPEEFDAGHRRGFTSAPGGQLVQATDTFVSVRGGRIVLADDDGVRARTTASWLIRMGLADVFVLADDAAVTDLEHGPAPETVLGLEDAGAEIGPTELAALLAAGDAIVVDTATSRQYRTGHIPGAWFAIRGRLTAAAARLPAAPLYVLTSPDGVIARLAARELADAVQAPVKVLTGGTDVWRSSGQALETGDARLASDTDDVALKAFEQPGGREAAMRDYLRWELDLLEQIKGDQTVQFRL